MAHILFYNQVLYKQPVNHTKKHITELAFIVKLRAKQPLVKRREILRDTKRQEKNVKT